MMIKKIYIDICRYCFDHHFPYKHLLFSSFFYSKCLCSAYYPAHNLRKIRNL